MSRVVALGALAVAEPDPDEVLADYERGAAEGAGLTPAEAAEMVAEYSAGEWVLARLHCFSDVDTGDGRLERQDGIAIRGLWFRVGEAEANRHHAEEMIQQHVAAIAAELAARGLETSESDLLRLPLTLDLEPALARAAQTA